ncbi:MAG: serine/threonine protein kinase [Bacteroidaceae bacterium]|nr:serine/threonine protein kinase [Bacteroidaceae bacterium]
METSSFSNQQPNFPDAELIEVEGATCDCYRVRLYGKLHFLKQLKPELQTDPQYVVAMQKEYETGYPLDHPNLVHYLSHGEGYILMDYVDGETLNQFITHHPDYFKQRRNADTFLHQLLSALQYLHEHQVLHLDLKPSNILITRIGHEVRLVDFGFCYTDSYPDTMGHTDKYAAPEQLDGKNAVDERTDIYAIGKIIEILPCARTYHKIITRCLQPEKAKRFQTIGELLDNITSQQLRRRIRMAVSVAAIMLSVALSGVWLFLKGKYLLIPTQEPDLVQQNTATPVQSVPPISTTQADTITTELEQPSTPHTEPQPPISRTVTPHPTHADTMRLRKVLQDIGRPIFERMIGTYRDSSYRSVGFFRFSELESAFRKELTEHYHVLWEDTYRHQDIIPERTFYREAGETCLYFINNLYLDMMRNDSVPEYADKVYHYYDSQKY